MRTRPSFSPPSTGVFTSLPRSLAAGLRKCSIIQGRRTGHYLSLFSTVLGRIPTSHADYHCLNLVETTSTAGTALQQNFPCYVSMSRKTHTLPLHHIFGSKYVLTLSLHPLSGARRRTPPEDLASSMSYPARRRSPIQRRRKPIHIQQPPSSCPSRVSRISVRSLEIVQALFRHALHGSSHLRPLKGRYTLLCKARYDARS